MVDDFHPAATIPFQGRPVCSGNATGRIAGEWGMSEVPCTVTRGLRSMIDSRGVLRHFCAVHEANVTRRFGRLSEATRVALVLHRISAEFEHSYFHPGPQDCRDYAQCHGRAYGESLRYTETDEGEFVEPDDGEFVEPDDGWREGQPAFNGAYESRRSVGIR